MKFIEVDLSVAIKENKIIAHLVFSNNTSEKVLLDKFIICYNNRIRNNYFKIFDKSNNRIDYIGPLVKRYITDEDFIYINPGEKIETFIDLNEVYKIKAGKKYTIQYSAYFPTESDDPGIIKVESNLVEGA